jgi:glutamate--cysteine ligase
LDDLLAQRLRQLSDPAHAGMLRHALRGIEREALRVDHQGHLAMTGHPAALGSALTHPQITTDYSEALLEFITPAVGSVDEVMDALGAIHRHVAGVLAPDELLWSRSMPAWLPAEDEIPIARYGSSHIGMLKHVYRRGLALRYGRRMQCIAGVHYNHSMPSALWPLLEMDEMDEVAPGAPAAERQSAGYFALIRNFQRYSWLLMVLFGASPALSSAFLAGREHSLQVLSPDTLFLPHATSLRMSDLGYQNDAQAQLAPPCGSLDCYLRSLAHAVQAPHAPYARLGTHRDGEWVQINTNVLQIENEYYATIRPKRVIERGERPLEALYERGVQYVEVRCLDIDPFEPLGIGATTGRVVEVFLLYCALQHSPPSTADAVAQQQANFAATVREGRRPGLTLLRDGAAVPLVDWGVELVERMQPVAALLDAHDGGGSAYQQALQQQLAVLRQLDETPSARVLQAVRDSGGSFHAWSLAQSELHAQTLRADRLSVEEEAVFAAQARRSLQEQVELERSDTGSFDDFVADYNARIPPALLG